MPDSIEVSTILPVHARRLYRDWLDSARHSAFTGGSAEIDPKVGGKFTAWDGYIQGTTLELEPDRRIVQAWRSSDFPPDSPDSRLELTLEEIEGGTQLTLAHNNIPEGQGPAYEEGWLQNYFEPMQTYYFALEDGN